MSELKLKIRNKIYTSGNHIVDTKNNNNAVVVFLGEMSSARLKPYVDNFLEDTLKSQIADNKITFVEIKKGEMESLPQKLTQAVKNTVFNPISQNELYISFVSVMDDDLYEAEHKIDISAIENLKVSALGGYAVDIYYDFYGIFVSDAKYSNRQNARKTIIDFLSTENGGFNIRKRIYHQSCPGDDYYRSAKSVTFMILANLINKLEYHSVIDSTVEGNNYTWTTFALFEKNLAALVIYEMINKLLENQVRGIELIAPETISKMITDAIEEKDQEMRKLASPNDVNYIPIMVRKVERELTAMEKAMNLFKKDKLSSVEYRKDTGEGSIKSLLAQQKAAIEKYVEENTTEAFMEELIVSLVKMCSVMGSVNNRQNEALIYRCLCSVREEYASRDQNAAYQMDFYLRSYYGILAEAKAKILDKLIRYYTENVDRYVQEIQTNWNSMNIEVNNMINDFAAFQSHFEGIGDLIRDKAVNLLCDYDDILEKIDVQSVIRAINSNSEIYSNILSSYYDNVRVAGEIAQRFGNCNIVPALENISYTLYSSSPVQCPGNLKLVSDDYWFRDYEIAILFTAKNNMSDCDNLPFSV